VLNEDPGEPDHVEAVELQIGSDARWPSVSATMPAK
jgi:hypothetical protein